MREERRGSSICRLRVRRCCEHPSYPSSSSGLASLGSARRTGECDHRRAKGDTETLPSFTSLFFLAGATSTVPRSRDFPSGCRINPSAIYPDRAEADLSRGSGDLGREENVVEILTANGLFIFFLPPIYHTLS